MAVVQGANAQNRMTRQLRILECMVIASNEVNAFGMPAQRARVEFTNRYGHIYGNHIHIISFSNMRKYKEQSRA